MGRDVEGSIGGIDPEAVDVNGAWIPWCKQVGNPVVRGAVVANERRYQDGDPACGNRDDRDGPADRPTGAHQRR
jgi:hypothetical protein